MNESLQWKILIFIIFYSILEYQIDGAIVPPPWSDPTKNPCATMPGGWQLLYWPPLKQCFKIFTIGYPCPETMELTPHGNSAKTSDLSAECRCPPGTAQLLDSLSTSPCYKLFDQGPCDLGQYFAPIQDSTETRTIIAKKRQGICKIPSPCTNGMVRWPQDSKCYTLHTKGPCSKGKLIVLSKNKIAECKCENDGELAQYFYKPLNMCFEHFTFGPCEDHGKLFLPGGKCGCSVRLPHYHEETDQCYELGSTGPCPTGHIFTISDTAAPNTRASCNCKEGYISWSDGQCYRMYTRGPCESDEFLINSTICIPNPCSKGRLYFPNEQTCYRIGTQGPCNFNQVVVFDFTARPSVDGISFNGVCGCSGIIKSLEQKCNDDEPYSNPCISTPGMVEVNGKCFKLYSRGPCGPGFWLEPRKITKRNDKRGVQCACRPGYTQYESEGGIVGCYPPSVGIARWLLNFLGYTNNSDGSK